MILFLKQLKENRIVKNLFALGFFQLTNYILPVLFVPYLVRVIGVERFGVVSFSQAIMLFLAVITDYGFNLTSTREVSLSRSDNQRLSAIYSVTLVAKMLLCVLTFIALVVAVLLIPKLREHMILHLLGFFMVIGQVLFPVWLFQGMEKMKFITYLNFIAKTITLVCVLLFVKTEADYILVLPGYAIGTILASLVAFVIIKRNFGISFVLPAMHRVWESLHSGVLIFLSNLSLTLYNSTIIIILGAFTNDTVVGYYSIADKIMQVPRQVLGVFSQAIYPHVCQLSASGWSAMKRLWNKVMPLMLAGVFVFCAALVTFAEFLVVLVAGEPLKEVILLVKLLAFVPFVVAFNISSYLSLLAFDQKLRILRVMLFASVMNILLNIILSYYFEAVGSAVALLITEVIIASGLYATLKQYTTTIQTPQHHGDVQG